MEYFWNTGEHESTPGLDILGIRQHDQFLEQQLVAGITTISFRARYLSLLPWVLAEFWRRETSGEASSFDNVRFTRVMRRLEFIVLACSHATKEGKSIGPGLLGADLHRDGIASFMGDATVDIPETTGGATYGTYVNTCRSFGLLQNGDGVLPVRLTPRGHAMHQLRQRACNGSALAAAVFEGGSMNLELARREAHLFSINALASAAEECTALRQALSQPFSEQPAPSQSYQRFRGTAKWVFESLVERPASSEMLIANAFEKAVRGISMNEVVLSWADYELRRRAHFCLELMLAAVTSSIWEMDGGTIDDAIARWKGRTDLPQPFQELAELTPETALDVLIDAIPHDTLLAPALPVGTLAALAPDGQAMCSALLLGLLERQTRTLRTAGQLADHKHYMERAFALIAGAGGRPFWETVRALCHLVVTRHIQVTLRKMANQQKCSLRFFPEGEKLMPTGFIVSPGYSGDRLGNFLNISADLGWLDRLPNGFVLAQAGHAALDEGFFDAL